MDIHPALTTAYFLSLMGHKVVVFEEREHLGGMLRYGIPNYRLPKNRLDEDINAILSTGNIEVRYNTAIGKDITMEQLLEEYQAVYIVNRRTGRQDCKGRRRQQQWCIFCSGYAGRDWQVICRIIQARELLLSVEEMLLYGCSTFCNPLSCQRSYDYLP